MEIFLYFKYIYIEFHSIFRSGMIYDLHPEHTRFTKVSDPSNNYVIIVIVIPGVHDIKILVISLNNLC